MLALRRLLDRLRTRVPKDVFEPLDEAWWNLLRANYWTAAAKASAISDERAAEKFREIFRRMWEAEI